MTLHLHEFIRRFLIHTLPKGLHRIRHYGLFASGAKAKNLTRMRALLDVEIPDNADGEDSKSGTDPDVLAQSCPCCGGTMRIVEVFEAGCAPHHVMVPEGIDSS